ncbi:hypothetical protein PINS_up004604 [Pythium insidiosum]|nr:hypothetical protein PINS_up004604 [Pythium insidiosum]
MKRQRQPEDDDGGGGGGGRGEGGGEGGRRGITAFGNGLYRPPDDPSKARKKVGEHHDGSYGVYMSHKIQKLRHQNASFVAAVAAGGRVATSGRDLGIAGEQRGPCDDATAAATSASASMETNEPSSTSTIGAAAAAAAGSQDAHALFHGVHVFVDGYTVPSKEEIRSMLLLHGGGFEHYETSQVTHIVATHLATSKLLQYK